MRSVVLTLTLGLFMSVAALLPNAYAQAAAPAAAPASSVLTEAQRAEVMNLIRGFVKDNPQALIASVESFYNKQNAEKEKQEGRMDTVPAGLYDNPFTPSVGPKDAKLTIVYFFDYNCGFCKQVDSDLNRVISEEKNVRFLFKELPILDESSEVAARWAVAADKQGKYLEFHSALMQRQGRLDQATIEQLAKDKGLDLAKLKTDAEAQDLRDGLQKNIDLARTLGVRGTPFFVIGKEKVPGAIGYTKMKEIIAKERDGVIVPQAAKDGAAAMADQAAAASGTAPDLDPEVQKEIDKTRAEVKAMLNETLKDAGATAPAAPAKK